MSFTVSYTYEIIDKATSIQEKINANLEKIEANTAKMAGKVDAGMKKAGAAIQSTSDKVIGLRNAIGEVAVAAFAFYGMFRAISAPLRAAISFESAMADVAKVVDFPEPDGLKKMGETIDKLAQRIPVTHEGLAAIVAQGGQLGIPVEHLSSFAEQVAKVSVAFDMMPSTAAEAMATISNAMNIPIDSINELADTINYMGNTGKVKERELIVAMQSGGAVLARSMNMTHNQALALASAFIEQGLSASEAGTRLEVLRRRLMNTGYVTAALGKQAGKQLSDIVKSNPQKAIEQVLLAIRSGAIDTEKAQKLLGLYAGDFILLAQNYDKYQDTLRRANNVTAQHGLVQKEFEKRSATTANALILLSNSFNELMKAIGNTWLEMGNSKPIALLVYGLAGLFNAMTILVKTFPNVTRLVYLFIASIAALIGTVLIAKAATFLFGSAMGLLVGNTVLAKVAMWGLQLSIIAVKLAAEGVRYAIVALGALQPIVTAMIAGWNMLNNSLKISQGAMILFNIIASLNPIGLIVAGAAALAGAAYLIIKHWDVLKGWFNSFFDWISSKFSWIFGEANKVPDNINKAIDRTGNIGINVPGAMPAGATPPASAINANVAGGFDVTVKNETSNKVSVFPKPNYGNIGLQSVAVAG